MISIDLRFIYYLDAKVQLFGDKRLFTSYHNMFKISENNNKKVLLKFWYIYVSKFEETFICKREIDALPPIIRFAVFILLTEPSRIPLFNLLAIELLMAE